MSAAHKPDESLISDYFYAGPNCAPRAISRKSGAIIQQLENSTVWLRAHHPIQCEGEDRPCTMHRRTQHHMRGWRQHWRGDRGIMERLCPKHGTGHPDPDSPFAPDSYEWIHGCCGCCIPPERKLRWRSFKPTHKINRKAGHA